MHRKRRRVRLNSFRTQSTNITAGRTCLAACVGGSFTVTSPCCCTSVLRTRAGIGSADVVGVTMISNLNCRDNLQHAHSRDNPPMTYVSDQVLILSPLLRQWSPAKSGCDEVSIRTPLSSNRGGRAMWCSPPHASCRRALNETVKGVPLILA